MDIHKRLVSGFIAEMRRNRRLDDFQKLLDNTPQAIVDIAYLEAFELFDFETLLLRSPSVKKFFNYDSDGQHYFSSHPPDHQKLLYSLGNNEKFIMFSELLNLDFNQITFALVEGNSMKDANIIDGDIVVVRNSDTAKNGDIIVAKVDDNYYVKRYITIDGNLWLHSENIDFEPILIPPRANFSIFGIVCNVIKNIN